MLGIQLIRHTGYLPDERRSCLPVARELARSEKNSGRAVPQQVEIVHFLAAQIRHGNRVRLRRRGLAISQQFARVLAPLSRTAKVFAEPPGLQLHLCPALVALQRWPVIPL